MGWGQIHGPLPCQCLGFFCELIEGTEVGTRPVPLALRWQVSCVRSDSHVAEDLPGTPHKALQTVKTIICVSGQRGLGEQKAVNSFQPDKGTGLGGPVLLLRKRQWPERLQDSSSQERWTS